MAGEIATFTLPRWILPRVMGAPPSNAVRPEAYCAYVGMMGILQGVLYFVIFGLGEIWKRTPDQILSGIALVLGFGLGGFALFYWAWKESITLTKTGLEFRYMFRKARHIHWTDIKQIKKQWLGYIVLKLVSGKILLVPESYQNTLVLLLTAKDKQVPISGYDLPNVNPFSAD